MMEASSNAIDRSPLDDVVPEFLGRSLASTTQLPYALQRWKPSRFNVQVTTDEGWLLLWNSFAGAMNAFQPAQRDVVINIIKRRNENSHGEALVKYLAERGYIVPMETDEVRRVQYEFGKENYRSDRLELILLASEDCNFRCTYCYEDFKRGTMRPEVRAGVKKLVEQRAKHLREMSVSWFGGEPLYGMAAIEDLAPFLAETAEREGIEYYSHMTTNGYLLTEDVVDRLLLWKITDFQITLDGLPDDHDKHRPRRDGVGTFETIYNNLLAMSRRDGDFSVVVRVNFAQSNAPGLEKFLELLKALFREDPRFTVEFHAVGRWGGDNDANVDVCGTKEIGSVQRKLKAAARTLGLQVTSGWHPDVTVGSEVCYAVRPYNFVIGAHGDVMKCTVDLAKKDRNIVGKLKPDGTLNLDADKMARWTEPAFERDTGCQSCHMLAACQGVHCPQYRMDHDTAPCVSIRRTAKQEMVDYFQDKRLKKLAVQKLTG